jgi:glycosyltransferase involved in cell wall biosynthesis
MHCGAAVIAGNNSSQVEVVGDAGLLFNAADAGELAARLARLLGDPAGARVLGERAVDRTRRFSWEETAEKALEVLTRSHTPGAAASPGPGRRRAPRRRIAFFSPLPPLQSGVSDYSVRLLEELTRRYAIDLYHDASYLPHIGLGSAEFGCYDYRLFERNARVLGYHTVVYQMGNSDYHVYMYDILLRHPGIVTMHELSLANFHLWYTRQPGVDGYAHIRRELAAYLGPVADEVLGSPAAAYGATGGILDACVERGYLLNGRIFERADAVIVHSAWCLDQVRGRFPAHVAKTSVVPFGATALAPSPEQRIAIRDRFQLPADALIVASLGLIHPTKMNPETIAAFAPLAGSIPGALLIFVGHELDFGAARRTAAELGLQDRVRFLGHHPADVLGELAAIADIGVCLRRPPTNGETSGALMDLLRLGVPTIVSDVGSFSDYPDSVVRKTRWEEDGVGGLARALRELAENRPGREALGRAAWDHVRWNHAWSRTADMYEEIIERPVAGRKRQVRGSLALSRPRVLTSSEWLQAAS